MDKTYLKMWLRHHRLQPIVEFNESVPYNELFSEAHFVKLI